MTICRAPSRSTARPTRRSRYATRSASQTSIGGNCRSMFLAIAWRSEPASLSAHGSMNSGRGHRLARARYAHTISAVFDAEVWGSTPSSYFFSKCATRPLYAVVTRIDSSVAAFCFCGLPACMSGWYLRIICRYDVLICAMSAPTWRSSTRYHSSTWASVLPGRGGPDYPADPDPDEPDDDEDDDQLADAPRAA